MIKIALNPGWIYGKDIVIDIVSIFTLLLISFFALRSYRIRKNKNYLFLSFSFILLSLSFLFKILMNFTIYYHVLETRQIGLITLTYNMVKSSNTLPLIGFITYRLLTLLGLFILYSIYQKQSKSNIIMIIYLLLVSTYFSRAAFYIFHLTAFILLTLITINFITRITKNYVPSKLLAISFGIISLSQLFFILRMANESFYTVGEIVQLMGYALLLFTFIMVLRYVRKENED